MPQVSQGRDRWTRRGLVGSALVLGLPAATGATAAPPPPDDEALLPGVVMPPRMAGRVRAMAHLFSERTGRRLVITGGLVGPEVIARRIVMGRRHGDDLRAEFRSHRRELSEILNAVERAGGDEAAQTRVAALTIAAQAQRGDYISPHLDGRAVDVRTIDLSQVQVETVLEAAAVAGLRARESALPPHVHVELADEGARR